MIDFDELLNGNHSIEEIAEAMDEEYQDSFPTMEVVGRIKDYVQMSALREVNAAGGRGMVVMATGAGKSRVACLYAKQVEQFTNLTAFSEPNILVVVPTEKLRDENWKEEFDKWGLTKLWEKNVDRTCYASLHKMVDKHYDLIIMDEIHNLTELGAEFFRNNTYDFLIALTATVPQDEEKKALLKREGIEPVYTLSLDIAVKLRIVSPYEVTVVEVKLEDKIAEIPAGSKDKPFLQTEEKAYKWLDGNVRKAQFSKIPRVKASAKFQILKRMRFIYELPSKTRAAAYILSILPEGERILTFCGGINQADALANKTSVLKSIKGESVVVEEPQSFHSKSSDRWFNAFKTEELDRMTCVNALNEGQNIPALDIGLVVQLNSNELNLIQRIGRILRYREGHIGKIIILVAIGTKDEDWMRKATASLDQSKITVTRMENILNGSFKL